MKGADNLKILDDELMSWCKSQFRRSDFTFQQDNSSVHTEKSVKKFLDRFSVLEWPACSPDLNIIENIWHLVELKLYERGQFKNDDQLWKAVQLAARKIDKSVIVNLYNSMPKQLLNVVKKKGGKIE